MNCQFNITESLPNDLLLAMTEVNKSTDFPDLGEKIISFFLGRKYVGLNGDNQICVVRNKHLKFECVDKIISKVSGFIQNKGNFTNDFKSRFSLESDKLKSRQYGKKTIREFFLVALLVFSMESLFGKK